MSKNNKKGLALARKRIQECIATQDPFLDLGNCGLVDLEELPELFTCTHIEQLNFSDWWIDYEKNHSIDSVNQVAINQLKGIPDTIKKCTKLTRLDLRSNQISDYSFLSGLSGLTWLDLRSNQISDISFLSGLSGLTWLDLSYNQISDISFLSGLSGLTRLDLSSNQISDISFLSGLSGLTRLDLSSNQISDISFLSGLSGLTTLYLSYNELTDISFLSGLSGLTRLDLSYNQLTDISFLSGLSGLTTLDLSSNQISDYSFLSGLSGLTWLDLRSNQISDISFLSGLSGLTRLDLRSNQLTDISFLSGLSGLTTLYLSYNELTDISFLSGLSGLTWLDLSYNQLTDISFLSGLSGLTTLDLSYNELTDISFLSGLSGLTSLDLRSNQLTDISFLSGLSGLTSLDLRYNQISDISFLSGLSGLRTLDLRSNQIIKIPKEILALPIEINLEEYGGKLNLYGNPIEEPPIEIIKQGKQSMLAWYEATKKKLNEIKIILIGDPKAGKTSLLRKLKDGTFKEDEVQTDGVNIEDIDFGSSDTFKKQTKLHHLTGHFWDFGGQEIMSATHNFFLTNRSVYVLVLDARKDKNVSATIRKEVKRIKATGGNSPIIVVANQIDINAGFGFENEYELQKEFPQIKYFIKTSCKTGTAIETLKEKLQELILSAELLNTEIDERWIAIKEQFQEELTGENYLDENRFLEICDQFKLTKESSQENALGFLHDLGLVLHFKEVKGYDYYVLNPYWITYGVYQILTSKKAGELQGEIPFSELEYIINNEEDKERVYQHTDFERIQYTKSQREFLVEILHEFKLCFILPDQQTFILPDLLNTHEPSEITKPIRENKDHIQFVYEYDALPRTIMPTILVETQQFHEKIWRTGCVLYYEKSKGFISQYDNRLSIIVVGEYKNKREFLAIIRNCINKINKKYSNQPKMLIPLGSIEEYVDYEELLLREKHGEKKYTIYKPTYKSFDISKLLDGFANDEELRKINDKLDLLLDDTKDIKKGVNIVIEQLDQYYEYLIQLPNNKDLKDILESSIQELNATQTKAIAEDLMLYIGAAFELQQSEIEENLKQTYQELTKTDNVGVKLKVGTPLIGVLGVGLEGEFDLKSWSQTMYKKHQWSIFQVLEKLY